ncbi:hypothetical protein IMSAG185_02061 [Lachnospiraceae bacterium]|nr:hypothetical protein IMSAG185_02061 [Lachnospiraceae bacterium]
MKQLLPLLKQHTRLFRHMIHDNPEKTLCQLKRNPSSGIQLKVLHNVPRNELLVLHIHKAPDQLIQILCLYFLERRVMDMVFKIIKVPYLHPIRQHRNVFRPGFALQLHQIGFHLPGCLLLVSGAGQLVLSLILDHQIITDGVHPSPEPPSRLRGADRFLLAQIDILVKKGLYNVKQFCLKSGGH